MDHQQNQYTPITTTNSGSKWRLILIILGAFLAIDIAVVAFFFLRIADEPNAVKTETNIETEVELETDSATFNTKLPN